MVDQVSQEKLKTPKDNGRRDTRSIGTSLKPTLVDFKRLFYAAEEKDEWGFYSESEAAIPRSSTLLITGAPGSGKTIFALSLVRSLFIGQFKTCDAMKNGRVIAKKVLDDLKEKQRQLPILYYVSLEIFPDRLRQAVKPFGWLIEEDGVFIEGEQKPLDASLPVTFRIITASPEVDRPVPGAEELLSNIFAQIERAQAYEEPDRPVIVIIDSLTALIRARNDYGERRRQTHETIFRLQKLIGKDKLFLTILIAEREFSGANRSRDYHSDPGNMVEEYLADIVFRLDTRSLPLGRRLRTLEIPKSQGLNIVIGEHTWTIVTNDTIDSLIEEQNLKRKIRESVGLLETSNAKFGTVVILPRSRGFSQSGGKA